MKLTLARAHGRTLLSLLLVAAAACGDDDDKAPPAPPPCEASAPALPAGQAFTLAGKVEYDFVPATYDPKADPRTFNGTLGFTSYERRPAREVVVQIRQCANVLATATTNAAGDYSMTFTPGPTGALSVVALAKTISPPIQVEDNTDGDAIWAVGQVIDSASATRSLHATHGWTGSSYDPAARSAAPFAILDSMYTAAKAFVDAGRSPSFPLLKVNWSPGNGTSAQSIGTSHYSPADGEIYVLGMAGDDTDEFDKQVIVHEWAHYFEDKLSRTESPGGPHETGDVLDPRLAFSEGGATALAAILLRDPIYVDTGWWDGVNLAAFGFDAESLPPAQYGTDDFDASGAGLNPGPFSEMSIIRAMYDLWDTGTNEVWDGISVELGVIYDVLVGPQKATPALTTLAPFVTGLKATTGVSATAVDTLLAHYSIGPISDEWGTDDADLRGMYRDVSVPSSGHSFTLDAGTVAIPFDWNMQQQNRYLVFTGTGSTVTVTSTSAYDVDLEAYHRGDMVDWAWNPSGNETLDFPTAAGETYVVVLTGWATPTDVNGPYSATVNISTP